MKKFRTHLIISIVCGVVLQELINAIYGIDRGMFFFIGAIGSFVLISAGMYLYNLITYLDDARRDSQYRESDILDDASEDKHG